MNIQLEAKNKTILNANKVDQMLQLNGILTSSHKSNRISSIQTYVVLVFELQVLKVYVKSIGAISTYEELDVTAHEKQLRVLMRTAIRTAYILELDQAVVTLSHQQHRQYAVHHVDPHYRWLPGIENAQKLLGSAVKQKREKDTWHDALKGKPLYGMDPEFILCNPAGKVLSAERYFQRKGVVGCDSMRIRGKLMYPLVELRPEPSADIRQLIIHLMQAMRQAAKQINDSSIEWLAGGMPKKGFSLGGHLHASGVPLSVELLKVLDNYLALPCILIEDSSTRLRRPRYGFLGDYRLQPHGGFEYRTLPSWIVSPRVTKGVLALFQLLVQHYRELKLRPLQDMRVQQYYYEGNKIALKPIVAKLWSNIEQVEAYSTHLSYLLPLREQMLSMKSWSEARDIRKAWRIP